ncbi:hypothetical protein RB595_002608 [Gaeumannomyces hyphopodioides]
MNNISAQATNGHPTAPNPSAPGSQQQQQPAWPSQSQAATTFSFPQAMLPIRIDTQAECLPIHQGGGSRAVATIILNASDDDAKYRSRGCDSMEIDGGESKPEGQGHRLDERAAKRVRKMAKREVQKQLKKAFKKRQFVKLIREHVDQYIREIDSKHEEVGSVAGGSSASSCSAETAPSRQQQRPPSSTRRPRDCGAMRGGGPTPDLGGDAKISPSTPPHSPQVLSPSSSSGRSFTPDSPPARSSQGGRERFAARPYSAQERVSGGEFPPETRCQWAYSNEYQSRGARYNITSFSPRPEYVGRPSSPRGASGIFGLIGCGGGGRSYQTYREQNDVDMSDG